MEYLTYEEYKNMGGTLSETAFFTYGYEAEMKIKNATFDRITVPSEAIKRCIVRITDVISKADITTAKISSYSHDGFSQTFSQPSSASYEKEMRKIIRTYLINEIADDGTPLLYCGVV